MPSLTFYEGTSDVSVRLYGMPGLAKLMFFLADKCRVLHECVLF